MIYIGCTTAGVMITSGCCLVVDKRDARRSLSMRGQKMAALARFQEHRPRVSYGFLALHAFADGARLLRRRRWSHGEHAGR